jgi:hypothetical protein
MTEKEQQPNEWKIGDITFHAHENINWTREEKLREKKVVFAFGPWVGELNLELNYWSSIIRFLKKEIYRDDIFAATSLYGHSFLYEGLDYYDDIDISYHYKLNRQYGPNGEFLDGAITPTKAFEEFLGKAHSYAKNNDIEDVILAVPSSKWKDITLGVENIFNDYTMSRMDMELLPGINDLERLESADIKLIPKQYVCIYPSLQHTIFDGDENNVSHDIWLEIIDYIIKEKNLEVVSLGTKKTYAEVEGSMYIDCSHPRYIDMVDYLTTSAKTAMGMEIGVLKNSLFSICPSLNSMTLSTWAGTNGIFLCDKNAEYVSVLGIFKSLIDLDKMEFVYEEELKSIPISEIKESIDLLAE